MAKTKNNHTIQGHVNGDADGLGPFRGAFVAFGLEVAMAVAYGVLLHFGVWR